MTCNRNLEQDFEKSGVKMTEQRRVIARVLAESDDHPDVNQLYLRAVAVDPTISVATVYRTVNLFEETGLLEKRDFGDGRARYEAAMEDDHHHHIIDMESGKIIEFRNKKIEEMKAKIAEEYGYELVECRLELYCRPIKKDAKKST
jgi:Fur family ferric uptake transcriptional regulator